MKTIELFNDRDTPLYMHFEKCTESEYRKQHKDVHIMNFIDNKNNVRIFYNNDHAKIKFTS